MADRLVRGARFGAIPEGALVMDTPYSSCHDYIASHGFIACRTGSGTRIIRPIDFVGAAPGGNSITDYIPTESYLVVLKEGRAVAGRFCRR